MWAEQIAFFAADYDVIALDLPGFGKSAHLSSHASIETLAAHVLEFLSALGVERFLLLGHSMGGMIVQQMTLDAPTRVTGLVCYGTGPVGVLPGRFETIERSRERLLSDGLQAYAERVAATWFIEQRAAAGYSVCESLGRQASLQAALDGLSAWEKWNVSTRLQEIECPTLIVWGERDKSYDFSQPSRLHEGIAGSVLKVVPDCAHNVHMERPDLFNQTLDRFLSSLV
jgi:pimeloyl-ACP methyl ester carboxylesterase